MSQTVRRRRRCRDKSLKLTSRGSCLVDRRPSVQVSTILVLEAALVQKYGVHDILDVEPMKLCPSLSSAISPSPYINPRTKRDLYEQFHAEPLHKRRSLQLCLGQF